ncbi:MAG TPA: hypothetical protein DHV70_06190 [Firmicutes bacterium]|nr:hypothetical protein [Bacillota bacterium]
MNIDELIAEISSEDFEFSLDSMTEQELSDLYQRLLDADDELQVRLTNLQESEPKPSQEEFKEVVENKRKIKDANQKVSEKWAQLSNSVPVNDQTPEQTPQNIEEDINEKIESEESIEDLERQLNENRKRLEMFNSIANRNGTNNFKSNRTTREIYEKRIQDLEEQIENLKNQEEKNDFESAIEENEERNTLDANNEPIALNEIEDSMSTKEKIDSIEKQMDTLFHQITQTKDDITRKKLSDKYFDLSNQLGDLKQQLKEEQTLNNEEVKDSMSTNEKIDSIEKQIIELEEKLKENAKVLEDAFEKGDKVAEKRARVERKDLFDKLMNLKKQQPNEKIVNNSNGSSENNSEKNNPEKNDEKTDEEKKEERRKKIKNAAFFALGGVIGIKLSFVLQPGTAGMVISVGRLVYSAAKKVSKSLKIYTEKHKDDELNPIVKKVGELNDKAIEGIEKGKKQINELLTSIPVINSFVHNVNNLLKKPETQIFLDGMAAGYTIGKLSQLACKMLEPSAIEKHIPDNTEVENNSEVGKTQPEFMDKVPDVDTQPDISTSDPVPEPTFDPTKPVDLSSLGEGYVSSYSSDPVSLITSAGKNAMFDKINVVDGKTWVHFTQGNGAGYAWFPAEDVMDALNISDISELTGKVSGGMHL